MVKRVVGLAGKRESEKEKKGRHKLGNDRTGMWIANEPPDVN